MAVLDSSQREQLGIHEYLRRLNGDRPANDLREELTKRLVAIFDKVARTGWSWFEDGLTYDNAKLAHALIVSGRVTGQESVGPMRKYCIGAFLLDRDDPTKVIGRLSEPLIKPNSSEREGHVPNVVYSCNSAQ